MFSWGKATLLHALDIVLCALSWIVPKKKRLVLFSAHHGDRFVGNPKFFFLYLLRDSSYQCVWVTRCPTVLVQLEQAGLPVVRSKTLRHVIVLLRAQWIIYDNNLYGIMMRGLYAFLGHFNRIQLYHSTCIKAVNPLESVISSSWLEKYRNFMSVLNHKRNLVIAASSEQDKAIKQHGFSNKRVEILGNARIDLFADSSLAWLALKPLLNRVAGRKIVLYAPTWRDYGAFFPMSAEEWGRMDEMLARNNSVMLLKKHPSDVSSYPLESCRSIMDVTAQVDDIEELLLETDLLVTDYSGVSSDFCVTGRPIIFFLPDHEAYTAHRKMFCDIYSTMPGPFASNATEAMALIEKSLQGESVNNPEQYAAFRKLFNDVEPGAACPSVQAWMQRNGG